MRYRGILWAAALSLIPLLAGHGAWAEKTTKKRGTLVVFGFRGKIATSVKGQIIEALVVEGYDFVPLAQVNAAALKMGYKKLPSSKAKRVVLAEKLEADAFIYGKVIVKKGGVRSLSLTYVVTCEKGAGHIIKKEWPGAISQETLASIVEQLGSGIGEAEEGCIEKAEVTPPVVEKPVEKGEKPKPKEVKKTAAEETAATPGETPGKEKGKGKEEGKGKEKEKKEKKEKKPAAAHCKLGGPRCGYPPALLVDAGILVSARSLAVSAGSRTYHYEDTYHLLAGAYLNLNIVRFIRKNPIFSVGIVFEFAHSFLLTSELREGGSAGLDTKDMRLGAGLEFVIATRPLGGKKPESGAGGDGARSLPSWHGGSSLPLWIFFDVRWAMHDFQLGAGPPANPIIADFSYRMVDMGVGFSADIIRRWLTIRARFGFIVAYSLGGAEEFYGDGAGDRFGFRIGLGLSGVLAGGFHWAAGFDFSGYTATFEGTGAIESNGYPSGRKLEDYYPTGYFMLGYKY